MHALGLYPNLCITVCILTRSSGSLYESLGSTGFAYRSDSQCMSPGPAAAVSPGRLLEMQILRLCPRPTNQTVWGGPSTVHVSRPTRDSDARCYLRTTDLGQDHVTVMSKTLRKPQTWTDLVLLLRLPFDKMGTLLVSRNHAHFSELL